MRSTVSAAAVDTRTHRDVKESVVGTKAHTNKGMVLVLACTAQFMVVLDVAVVNVALPSIQRDLGIGQSTLQWIIIAYGLMLGGFLLTAAIGFPRRTTHSHGERLRAGAGPAIEVAPPGA